MFHQQGGGYVPRTKMDSNYIYLCEVIDSSHTNTIKFSFILCLKTLPHNTRDNALLYSFALVTRELKIHQTSFWSTVSSQLKTYIWEYAFSYNFYNSTKTTASSLTDTTFLVIFIFLLQTHYQLYVYFLLAVITRYFVTHFVKYLIHSWQHSWHYSLLSFTHTVTINLIPFHWTVAHKQCPCQP